MEVFQAKNYVEFVTAALQRNFPKIPRGAVKSLAAHLKCHPTFISQSLRGKAYFSHEQAVRFCSFAKLPAEESEFFIDLLNRDRAATIETRFHFQQVLDRKLRERNNLQKRASLKTPLSQENEILYFQNWLHPLVHAALNLPQHNQVKVLAKTLGISQAQIRSSLELLASIGLAKKEKDNWSATKEVLHVGKDSPLNRNFHAGLRMKTASALMEGGRTEEHTHFSSIFCISHKDAQKFRNTLLDCLKDLRQKMVESDPERIYTLCLDYYPADAVQAKPQH